MDSEQTERINDFKYIVINEEGTFVYCNDKQEAIEAIQATSTQFKQKFIIAKIENILEASVKTEQIFTLTENEEDVSVDGRGRLVKKERRRTFSATDSVPLTEEQPAQIVR